MGSVPRINCLLAIVPSKKVNDYIKHLAMRWYFHVDKVYQYDILNKGVSIVLILPYTLKFVISYSITSNSKAA